MVELGVPQIQQGSPPLDCGSESLPAYRPLYIPHCTTPRLNCCHCPGTNINDTSVIRKRNLNGRIRQTAVQGCISCGVLLSGTGARGVSSEHMENVEMFSENCALVWLSENRDLVLRKPCSGSRKTVLRFLVNCSPTDILWLSKYLDCAFEAENIYILSYLS